MLWIIYLLNIKIVFCSYMTLMIVFANLFVWRRDSGQVDRNRRCKWLWQSRELFYWQCSIGLVIIMWINGQNFMLSTFQVFEEKNRQTVVFCFAIRSLCVLKIPVNNFLIPWAILLERQFCDICHSETPVGVTPG